MALSRSQQQAYLDAMGIQGWVERGAEVVPSPLDDAQVAVAQTAAAEVSIEAMDWPQLQRAVAECSRCELHASRTNTVFGAGDPAADWLVIGEAPGADEDRQGEPFVGRAGQLLNAMLKALNFERRQVFIANILKCRPPNNRDPRVQEVACCEPYLQRQVALIQPKLILALGRVAAQNLLKSELPIGKLRGTVHRYGDTGIPVIATYHPAYLLRAPAEKRKAWQDLQLAYSIYKEAQGA